VSEVVQAVTEAGAGVEEEVASRGTIFDFYSGADARGRKEAAAS